MDRLGVGRNRREGVVRAERHRVALVRQFPFVVDRVRLRYGDWHYQSFLAGLPIGGSV